MAEFRSASAAFAVAVAALAIATFSAMDAVMKGQAIAIGAAAALLWRSLFGFVMGGALFVGTRRAWPPRARVRVHVQRAGAAAVSILLFFWGLARTPMAEAIALTFLAPLIATYLAALLLGERVRRGALFGSALALAGVAAILAARGGARVPQAGLGAAAVLAASVFYGYSLVMLRRSAQASDPIEITFFTNLVMLAAFAALAPWLGAWPGPGAWPMLLAASLLQLVSSLLLAWAYARAEAQLLATTEYSAFLWAAAFGWLFYGERLGLATAAGAALIVAGCLVAARRGTPAAAVQTEAAL